MNRHADRGTALATTLVVMAVMMSLSLVLLQRSLSSERFARNDQDWNAAFAAAQAGVDDYVQRLNNSSGDYYVWNTGHPDPDNQAMGQTAGAPNWADVPQVASGTQRARFHYDVDTSSYTGTGTVTANGTIMVTSTGRSGSRTRTLQASIRREGFLDQMYFTDFETKDPSAYVSSVDGYSASWAQTNCADRYWDARYGLSARNVNCIQIMFASDTLDGPVFSNDAMLICDHAIFRQQVSTAYVASSATSNHTYRSDKCSSPYTNRYPATGTSFTPSTNNPKTVSKLNMPSTNASLKAITASTATPRGCLYVGPTKIVIKGDQIKVTSPWTKPASLPSHCKLGTYFSIPVAGVVYVDDVPSDGTTDPNSWGASESGKPSCPASTTVNANNVGYPITGETSGWVYQCRVGDVFIEEESGSSANALDGRLTVGSANDTYITDNIHMLDGTSGQSLLGLIADGFIYYWHPVNAAGNNVGSGNYPSYVQACLVSVDHSITTQNYSKGADLGSLNVTGSLTQKYRGIVRSGTSGYAKNYLYDSRLTYDSPPNFLSPTASSFKPAKLAETAVAYRAG